MIIIYNRDSNFLHVNSELMRVSCVVRNELNGWRPNPERPEREEVVRSIPDNKPYMPRPFPVGRWIVGKPIPKKDRYMAPYFIPTNAWQKLPVWELDDNGGYLRETEETVIDKGYGLHYSLSGTTLGCIKVDSERELRKLVDIINQYMDKNETIYLDVI